MTYHRQIGMVMVTWLLFFLKFCCDAVRHTGLSVTADLCLCNWHSSLELLQVGSGSTKNLQGILKQDFLTDSMPLLSTYKKCKCTELKAMTLTRENCPQISSSLDPLTDSWKKGRRMLYTTAEWNTAIKYFSIHVTASWLYCTVKVHQNAQTLL